MKDMANFSNSPLVTVLLPVYNRQSVAKTIDSILAQTFEDFELLVVDNASNDHTVDVVRSYSDKRIRLIINEENMGQTYSLNRGLSLSQGKYIARIDADDIALPERLEKQYAFLESHADYGLCGCWVQYINDEDKLTLIMKMCQTDEGLRTMQKITCGMYHPAAMMRTSVLRRNNITYDPSLRMASDYYMWFRIMQYSKGQNLGEVLLYYRRGNNNEGRKHADEMYNESYRVRREICDSYANGKQDRERLRREIDIELKSKKSFTDSINIYHALIDQLKAAVGKRSIDYRIIKHHIILKIYSVCIANNSAGYARVLDAIYHILLAIRYRLGKKAES